MTIDHIEFLVEDPSMEAALRILLPRMIGGMSFEIHPFQCKDALISRLPERLRGYAARLKQDEWFRGRCRVMIVIDRDNDECHELKARLDQIAARAGLSARTTSGRKDCVVVNRLAIEELEAWYFGDWEAVRASYPRVPATIPSQERYRNPDAIKGGTWEALERILKKAGYFETGLAKIQAAKNIAQHMVPTRNSSRSFQLFRMTLGQMAAG